MGKQIVFLLANFFEKSLPTHHKIYHYCPSKSFQSSSKSKPIDSLRISRKIDINSNSNRTYQSFKFKPTDSSERVSNDRLLIIRSLPARRFKSSNSNYKEELSSIKTFPGELCRTRLPPNQIRRFSSSSSLRKMPSHAPKNLEPIEFPITPYPKFDNDSRTVRTAACIVIADEVLNGKTQDTNSHFLATLLFGLGISLRKIEVIPDDESVIVDTVRRLTAKEDEYDIIFTSGGIGPTHDDITYQSMAKVFDESGCLKYDEETLRRMNEVNSKHRRILQPQTEEQLKARSRMALFPEKFTDRLFVLPHLWVPVVTIKNKIFIFPGIPGLFQQLVESLMINYIKLPTESEKPQRRLVRTALTESIIAPFLSKLSKECWEDNIRIGSYPNIVSETVTVSLIGNDVEKLAKYVKILEDHFKSIIETSPFSPVTAVTKID